MNARALRRAMQRGGSALRGHAVVLTTKRMAAVSAIAAEAAATAAYSTSAALNRLAPPKASSALRAAAGADLMMDEEEDEVTTTKEKILPQHHGTGPPSRGAARAPTSDGGDATVSAAAANSEVESTPLAKFEKLLSPQLRRTLMAEGVTGLFPVQKETLEKVMGGQNIVVRSKTGSGKTLGFALPIIEKLSRAPNDSRTRSPRCLVLTPTRELARQVSAEFSRIAGPLRVATVYGGAPITNQITDLRKGVDIVVGTPGRIQDMIDRGVLALGCVQVAVLDEADEMLRMGFKEDVEAILENTPKEKQAMLWSATMPPWVRSLASRFLDKPVFIDLVGDDARRIPVSVTLSAHIVTAEESRRAALMTVVRAKVTEGENKGGAVLVFTETKHEAQELASMSWPDGVKAAPLTGDLDQRARERTLERFKAGEIHVICATDVASRGLDITGVQLVVQYRLPNEIEPFTHRVGRTGRAGRTGDAVIFIRPNELRAIGDIESELGVPIHVRSLPIPRVEDKANEGTLMEAARAVMALSAAQVEFAAGTKAFKAVTKKYGNTDKALQAALVALAVGDADLSPRGLLTGGRNRLAVLVKPGHPAFVALTGGTPPPKQSSSGRDDPRYENECNAMLSRAVEALGLQPVARRSAPMFGSVSSSAASPLSGPWYTPEGMVLEMAAADAQALIEAVASPAGSGLGVDDAAVRPLTDLPLALRSKVASAAGGASFGGGGDGWKGRDRQRGSRGGGGGHSDRSSRSSGGGGFSRGGGGDGSRDRRYSSGGGDRDGGRRGGDRGDRPSRPENSDHAFTEFDRVLSNLGAASGGRGGWQGSSSRAGSGRDFDSDASEGEGGGGGASSQRREMGGRSGGRR